LEENSDVLPHCLLFEPWECCEC